MHQRVEEVWQALQAEGRTEVQREPLLSSFYHATIVSHASLRAALSYLLAEKLSDACVRHSPICWLKSCLMLWFQPLRCVKFSNLLTKISQS